VVVGRIAADPGARWHVRIIGAGLPRTATLAQKIALETLGQGPCYHMVTVLADLDRVGPWLQALAGDCAWGDIFAGFHSTVDWPAGYFYRELIDVYPDAKVVLSTRDPDRWAASLRATVLAANRADNVMGLLSQARALIDPRWRAFTEMTDAMVNGHGGLGAAGDQAALADGLRRHVDEVKATVPARRLLVWRPEDGWEPLCDFVGAPVPDVAFPHVNDSATFEDRVVEGALEALHRYQGRRHRSDDDAQIVLGGEAVRPERGPAVNR
jgi:hypothetical protein